MMKRLIKTNPEKLIISEVGRVSVHSISLFITLAILNFQESHKFSFQFSLWRQNVIKKSFSFHPPALKRFCFQFWKNWFYILIMKCKHEMINVYFPNASLSQCTDRWMPTQTRKFLNKHAEALEGSLYCIHNICHTAGEVYLVVAVDDDEKYCWRQRFINIKMSFCLNWKEFCNFLSPHMLHPLITAYWEAWTLTAR